MKNLKNSCVKYLCFLKNGGLLLRLSFFLSTQIFIGRFSYSSPKLPRKLLLHLNVQLFSRSPLSASVILETSCLGNCFLFIMQELWIYVLLAFPHEFGGASLERHTFIIRTCFESPLIFFLSLLSNWSYHFFTSFLW